SGGFVAIMARHSPEHVLADVATLHTGATPVSIYNTLAPEQIAYVAGHCEAKVAIVEDAGFMERWEKVKSDLPNLQHVVLVRDAADFADRDWVVSWDQLVDRGRAALEAPGGRVAFGSMWRSVKPEDVATLVYTSGTTGPPKGVATTHRNALWTAVSVDRMLG